MSSECWTLILSRTTWPIAMSVYGEMPMRPDWQQSYNSGAMNRIVHRWLRRPWFSALLLTALLFRALVPVGFMPGVGTDGRFTVILCPGVGAVPAALATGHDSHAHMPGMAHHSDHAQHDHAGHAAQSNCPYAGATAGMAPVHVAPATVLLESLQTVTLFPPDQFVPRGMIVPTRLPRGPPSLA